MKSHRLLLRRRQRAILAGSVAAAFLSCLARGADQTWNGGSLIDGQWSSPANWLGGTAPGSPSATDNADVATFKAAAGSWGNSVGNPVVIDSGRNIRGINFDAAADNYFIGGTVAGTGPGGNALLLTGNGAIQILNTLTSTNAVETINAPLVVEGAFATYAFINNSANGNGTGAGTLLINGGITGGTAGNTMLNLGGSNTNANTISGVIADGAATTVGVTKSGIGAWALSGANTYTGSTNVTGGTLALSFGAVSANILPSTSALTLSSGTLSLSGTGTQTVSGLTTAANTGNKILLGANETLTLGALTSAGSGSALNFNTVAGGANAKTSTIGTGVIVLTGQTAGNAINSGFTVSDAGGFGLATVNASSQVVRLTSTALLPASGASSATDYRIDNNAGGFTVPGSSALVISASESARSITVDTTTANGSAGLNSGVVLSSNTWNFGGNGSNTWRIAGNSLGAGLKATTSGASINFNNYNTGQVTIASPILANGTNAVNVYGTGTLTFAGANTYTGNTTVSGGTLRVASNGSINTSSAYIYVGYNPGDNGTLSIAGGSVSSFAGILGYGAGSSGTATVSSGSWFIAGNFLNVGYGGTGTLNVTGGSVSGSAANTVLNVGASSCIGIVNIAGGSVSNFNAINIGQSSGSTATVTISGGTLNSPITVGGTGSGVLNINGGTVTSSTMTLAYSSGSTGTLNIGTGGTTGTLQASTITAGSGLATVNFNHTGSYTFTPSLSGPLSVNHLGAGTTILSGSSNYTGPTTISAGQVIATNASALGNSAVTVGSGAGLSYFAGTNTSLNLRSTLAINGGPGTVLGGAIGSTTTSAQINVTGAASATGAVLVNLSAFSGITPLAGTNNYTLLTGGAGSSLNGATYSLGTVYGNTNFTVGSVTSTATTLQVGITRATAIASAYWVGGLGGATNVWAASNGSTASNWATTAGGAVQGLIPGAGANVVISATAPVTAPVATVLGANMSIAGLTIADTVNGLGLNADGFALTVGSGGVTMNAGVPASTIGANVVLASNQTWTNNSANSLTVSGVVSGNSSLTKAGNGTLILSGANSYIGATTINAGLLQLGSRTAIGKNSAVTLANIAGAGLSLGGFDTTIASLTGGGTLGGNIDLGAGNLTIQANNSPATYGGILSGTGGSLTKIGTAALTLTGASIYTGQTTVSGPLVLAFGSVTSNILPSASSLVLRSTTLSLTGTGTQTFASLSTDRGDNQILLGANQTLNLGYLSGETINTALNFNTVAGGANASTSTVGTGIIVLNILSGLPAGSALNAGFTDYTITDAGGFGLAAVNTSNQVVRLTTTALLPASGAASPTDYLINNNAGGASAAGSSSLSVSASQSARSITVDTTAASGVLTLNPGVVLSSNIWNFGGVGSHTFQISGNASGAGLRSVNSGNTISFANYNPSPVTISSPVLANGNNAVNIFGTGTLVFAGVNTYTGTTTIAGGTLEVPAGGVINANAANASLFVGASSGANAALNITGGSVISNTGYIAYGAGSTGTATVSSGSWAMTSELMIGGLGSGVLNLSGGTITTGLSDLATEASASGTATVTGGTWTNSSDLNVGRLGVGILNIAGGNVSNLTSYLGSSAGASGTVSVSGGTWTNSTSLNVGYLGAGVLNLTGNGLVTVGSSGTGTLTLGYFGGSTGTLNVGTGGAAGTLQASKVTGGSGTAVVNFNHTGSSTFAPNLTGSLSVNHLGNGTTILTGTNTYTGATLVQAGALLIDGSLSSATTVTGAGTLFGGNGTVGNVSVGSGAILEGGDGSGAFGALTSGGTISLTSGSMIEFTLGPGGTHSSLARTGGTWSFDLDQTFVFNLQSGAAPGTYDNIITGLTGVEAGLANIANWMISTPGMAGTFSYDNAGNVDLNLTVAPEPTTVGLLLGGLALLGYRRRRPGRYLRAV